MKTAIATLESVSPYGQNGHQTSPKLPKESADDYEIRTWRDRLHVNPEGFVFVPPMAFKNCLSDAANYLSVRKPGKGTATYTKHFEAGVLVTDPLVLPIKKEEVGSEKLFLPSTGIRGAGKRVTKFIPRIDKWEGEVTFHILDDTITEEVFEQHLREAGRFIGIGFFRPRNNGFWGRFNVKGIKWSE